MNTWPIKRGEKHGSSLGIRTVLLAITVAGVAIPASAANPEGVSPGAVDRIAASRTECPTFSWGAADGAARYEIVVYQVATGVDLEAGLELSPDDEVLYTTIVGSATTWTPELDRCFASGGRYVWFVRAAFREEAGEVVEASDWSAARFFSVPAAPSAEQVRQAHEVLQSWEAANRGGSLTLSMAAASAPDAAAASDSRSGSGSNHPKSVPTATAAIRGTIPDATGETYGVVGITNSPNGAGVAAANTAGGPDLVLDGSEDLMPDAEFSQSGINRPWATPQTFNIQNSAGTGMTLQVDGVEVTTTDSALDAGKLTSGTVPNGRLAGTYSQPLTLSNPANDFTGSGAGLTGVDADTLDGTDGATFATDAEAAALVATHAASAAHDGRYYTKTQLNTSGAGGAVNWNNLTAVPAGFADGVDDGTTYIPGPGLIIDGDQILIDPGAFSTRISTLDHEGVVGPYTSIAIGVDGLGLISYYDNTNHDLKVAHCSNAACSSATTATLDSTGDVGWYTSIAIGADGLGLISYFDWTNGDLKVAHCADTACSSATKAILDHSPAWVGQYTAIVIGADGLGLISYYDATNTALKIAHCANAACSSASTATLDSTGDVGWYTSIAIGADGLGLISYREASIGDLKVAHCANAACSSASTATLDNVGDVGEYTSIAIGADGLGLISYYDFSNHNLKTAHCANVECSSATTATVDGVGGPQISIAIGADGLGLISYADEINGGLRVAHCGNVECSSTTIATVDSVGGSYTSIAIGADGLGLISFFDSTNFQLKAAHLGIGVP